MFFIKKNIPLTVSYSNLISLFSKVSCPLRDCYHCVSEWVLEEKPISFFYDLTIYLWKYIASLKYLFIMNNDTILFPLIRLSRYIGHDHYWKVNFFDIEVQWLHWISKSIQHIKLLGLENYELVHFCSTESCNYINAIILYLNVTREYKPIAGLKLLPSWLSTLSSFSWEKSIAFVVLLTWYIYLCVAGFTSFCLFFNDLILFSAGNLITAFGRNTICTVLWLILYLFTLNEDGCIYSDAANFLILQK